MNTKQRILLIGIAAALLIGGFFYWDQTKQGIVATQDGKQIYKNAHYGFEFSYPPEYRLEDYEDSDSLVVVSKRLIPNHPSLTGFFVSIYTDADVMFSVTENNIICTLKEQRASFGSGKLAKEYACGDAGTTERRFLMLTGRVNTGLMVSITTDAATDETPKEYNEIPPEVISEILSSFKFTK